MDHSEKLQQVIIDESVSQADEGGPELQKIHSKLIEDKYFLAFRQYTRAIVSYNLFVTMDIESRAKFSAHDKSWVEHRKQFDQIGFDALDYFQKSLDSWPCINSKETPNENSQVHSQEES